MESERSRLYYDPNSNANFNKYRIVHTDFNWNIDFDNRILQGSVKFNIKKLNHDLCYRSSTILEESGINEIPHDVDSKLILDAYNLNIEQIIYQSDDVDNIPLPFEIDSKQECLIIDFLPIPQNISDISIIIYYSTFQNNCKSLQWLTKHQTTDRQYPYLFSQCQSILARSLYPCQDTPGVKSTYTAQVTCPKPLIVVMSSIRTNYDQDKNTFYFEQTIPVSSYLIAIAVGHLVSFDFTDYIRVWAEPSLIEQCKYEFNDVETFVLTAQNLLGKYLWKRYDFIILPPSLPYGGMENPCMNFISPTILAGDRSLVGLIVHELIHSWTGNLITNENWEHFWLNEGITSFIEAKLMGILNNNSDEIRRFYSAQQWEEMETDINDWGLTHPYTCLVYRLRNINPDDAYSSVQYFKGSALLWHLEKDIVRSDTDFDRFLRSYVTDYSYRIVNTDDFIKYFQTYFPHAPSVDWNSWLYSPGMPPIKIDFSTSLEQKCRDLAKQYSSITIEQIDSLDSNQIAYLLNILLNEKLEGKLDRDRIKKMHENCRMSRFNNCEICYRWYQLCIRVKYDDVLNEIFAFLERTSRMKYNKVIYAEFKSSWPEVMPKVKEFFNSQQKYMHPITIQQIQIRI